MRKTFQFKLYQSKKNQVLHDQIDLSAEIYNHCVALHKRYYKMFGKSLNTYQLQKYLTKLKKQEKYQHWNLLGSQAIQDITDRIDRAYQAFYTNVKDRKTGKIKRFVAPPSFKKRGKYKSLTLKQAGYRLLEGNRIKIGKQVFKFSKSRAILGLIKTLTVKRDPLGEIYLYFSSELPDPKAPNTQVKNSVGMDFGLKTFLTLSNGEKIESPQFFKKGLNAIRKANKNFSSKKKGSNHRKQAKINLARAHKKIGNQRKDFHFKLAKKLTDSFDVIIHEDLHIKAMQQLWGRKISDLGFSDFVKILSYEASQNNKITHAVDRFFPSSKKCNCCCFINDDLQLKDRFWTCLKCETLHDRDENAAINIHSEGASSLRLGNVRPSLKMAVSV